MSGLQPPGIPVFYPGYDTTTQFNTGINLNGTVGGIRDTFTFMNNKPKFRARRAASALPTASGHQWVVFDTVDFDNYNGWGPSQTPAQSAAAYVVQVPGWYLVTARVSLSGTGAANLVLIPAIAVNGNSPTGLGGNGWEGPELFVPTGAASQPKSVNGCWELYAPLGAIINLDLWYSGESTITQTDTTAGFQPELSLVWTGK